MLHRRQTAGCRRRHAPNAVVENGGEVVLRVHGAVHSEPRGPGQLHGAALALRELPAAQEDCAARLRGRVLGEEPGG